MKIRYIKLLPVLITAIMLNACLTLQVNPVSGNKRAYGYSWEEEIEIGRQADKEIVAQYGVYEDEALSDYVSELGQLLLEDSHLRREGVAEKFQNTEFTFRVLNSPVVNAFALPGGYVYVTRGLLAHLNNEAQLAVVLGHEIGHVAARHASQRAATQQIGQLAIIGGALLGESIGLDGGNILQLSSQTAQLLFLQYSRDNERESDRLGVEYSAMNKYEAAEGAKFFESLKRISERQGGGIPSHLSTHPDPGEREATIPELAESWKEKGYEQTILDQDEFMAMLDDIIYDQNPREGFERDGVFYHPELEFKFPVPDGFNVINQTSAVILINEDQDAVTQFTIDSENNTPKASVQSFVGQEGITVIEQGDINRTGYNAYEAEATAETQDGTTVQLIMTALKYNDRIYQFLSYTNQQQFSQYENDFMSISSGFDRLTDVSVLTIEPVRLQLVEASSTAPFNQLLPSTLPMDITAEDLAIINQVGLNENIVAGTVLKLPVQ
ncbi:MAG: peptidase M48 [Balneolaceae bacterium]|nr:peptidase M48 [Balneolaceae bacterium]